MRDWTQIQERYLRDDLPVRLGGLAANLSRIKSFSANEAGEEVVEGLIDESKMFIEWTAAQTEINTAEKLVELQIQLALWQLQWETIWKDPIQEGASCRTVELMVKAGFGNVGIIEIKNTSASKKRWMKSYASGRGCIVTIL